MPTERIAKAAEPGYQAPCGHWSEEPLRQGEYDVPVMFRLTAESQEDAERVAVEIVADMARGRGENHIFPAYVP